MNVHTLPLGPIQANCYLLHAPRSAQAVLLDPGGDAETLLSLCRELSLTPAAILLTHGHFDHVGAVPDLLSQFPQLPLYLHPADFALEDPWLYPLQTQLAPAQVQPLSDGARLDLAGLSIEVLHTPGHSPGSVVFRAEDCLFTGDTLFSGSVGRTDLTGGDPRQLMGSLRRLAALEGDLRVCPGHGDAAALDAQRRSNPYLREAML